MNSTDFERITRLHEAWIDAEVEGSTAKLLAMCSDDVVIAPPGETALVGAAQAKGMLELSAHTIDRIVTKGIRIEVFGGFAVKTAQFSTKIRGSSRDVSGTHLWVLKPRWVITYMTWNIVSIGDQAS
jgi:ketosteroid isomerase-like protein